MHLLLYSMVLGILSSTFIILFSIYCQQMPNKDELVAMIAKIYYGFDLSVKGVLIGAFWGFLDGFMCSYIILWFFQKLVH